MDLLDLSARQLADALRRGESTVEAHLARVFDRIDRLDSYYQAFSHLRTEDARVDAARLDAVPSHERGHLPLFGVPVAIKEEMAVAGMITTLGTRANTTPAPEDSEVVARLRRAGAVIVGKTHMPEFGQVPFTDGPWGATRNPFDGERSPGGSSGGSAVAVATGMVPVALGGDGGGSVRIPAAWTGLVGIKPTRGLVPTAPLPDLWFKLGTYGPLARDVDDVALLLDLIGPPSTPTSPTPDRLRVGWTLQASVPGFTPDPELAQAVEHAARLLATAGHDVHRGTLRYGASPTAFLAQCWLGIDAEVKRMEHPELLEQRSGQVEGLARRLPRFALQRSLRTTDRIEAAMRRVFQHLDVLVTPVTPQLPPTTPILHDKDTLTSQRTSTSVVSYTSFWNMAGNPAASVPLGLSTEGLPLAVQIIGAHGRVHLVLDVARQLVTTLTPVDRGVRR